jgi:hypothetical protein
MVESTNSSNTEQAGTKPEPVKKQNLVLVWVVILGIVMMLALTIGVWNIGQQLQTLNTGIDSVNTNLNGLRARLWEINQKLPAPGITTTTTAP